MHHHGRVLREGHYTATVQAGGSAYLCNDDVIGPGPASADSVWTNCFLSFYARGVEQPAGDSTIQVDDVASAAENDPVTLAMQEAASDATEPVPHNNSVTLAKSTASTNPSSNDPATLAACGGGL